MRWLKAIAQIQIGIWPHRLAARTLASHAGNRGSIPLGATNFKFNTIQ
jgi:hypothetical protein